jgi:hypothetical protein
MPADHPGLCELLWVDLKSAVRRWLVSQTAWRKMALGRVLMPQIAPPEYDGNAAG